MKKTFTSKLKAICLLAICFGVVSTSKAQVASVLADIQNGTASSSPATGGATANAKYNFPKVGNKVVFRATDGATGANSWMHGTELFVLDVTQPVTANGGTSGTPWSRSTNPQMFDLWKNVGTSNNGSGPQELFKIGNKVYFSAAQTTNGALAGLGQELWVLDLGTAIADSADVYGGSAPAGSYGIGTNPGAIDLFVSGAGGSQTLKSGNPSGFFTDGNNLFFHASVDSLNSGGAKGLELWVLDPSQAISSNNGTSSFTSSTNPRFINIGADDAGKVDGVGAAQSTSQHQVINGKVYFTADAGPKGASQVGAEIWVYDPSNATTSVGTNPKMVAEINPTRGSLTNSGSTRSAGSNPAVLTNVGGKLFFMCQGADTLTSNQNNELWVYDPSQAVADSNGTGYYTQNTNPYQVMEINKYVFNGDAANLHNYANPSGVIAPSFGTTGASQIQYTFPQLNGRIYFAGRKLGAEPAYGGTGGANADSINGLNGNNHELWTSDGTAAGTRVVKSLKHSSIANNIGTQPSFIYTTSNRVYWSGVYGTSAAGTVTTFVYDPSQDTTAGEPNSTTSNPKVFPSVAFAGSAYGINEINGLVYMAFVNSSGLADLAIYDPAKATTATCDTTTSSNPRLRISGSGTSNWNPKYISDLGNGNIVFTGSAPTTTGGKGTELCTMNIYNAITASAGSNGSISTSGVTNVNYGYNQSYTITPANGYCIDSLIVDGVKVSNALSYTFSNVKTAHTISVTFAASAGTPSVSISTATTTVCSGSNVSFNANSTNGGSSPTYEWRKNGVNAGSGSSITFLSGTLSNNDVISCVLTTGQLCNPDASSATSNSIQLTVNASPSVAPITNGVSTVTTSTVCTLGTTAHYFNGTINGTWSSSNPTVASVAGNGLSGFVTANTNGTATITYSVTSSGCVSTSSLLVTVAAITPNSITGTNSICVNATTALSCTAPVGTTGVWTSSNNRGTINVGGVYTGANAGAGEARYSVTNSTTGCKAYSTYAITVNVSPSAPSITYALGTTNPQAGAPGGSYCANRTFTVVGIPSGGVWSSTGVLNVTTPAGLVTTGAIAGAGTLKYTYTSGSGCSNSRTISGNVFVCAARGVATSGESLTTSNDFTMYPNPSKGVINLNVETLVGTGSVVVTDLYGKAVKNQVLSMGSNTVNISNLSKGFYLVSVITAEGKNTKKLIVE